MNTISPETRASNKPNKRSIFNARNVRNVAIGVGFLSTIGLGAIVVETIDHVWADEPKPSETQPVQSIEPLLPNSDIDRTFGLVVITLGSVIVGATANAIDNENK